MPLYLFQNGERSGPFGDDEVSKLIQEGRIDPTDLAWENGMTDWKPICQIRAFFSRTQSAENEAATSDEHTQNSTAAEPGLGAKLSSLWKKHKFAIAIFTLVCWILRKIFFGRTGQRPTLYAPKASNSNKRVSTQSSRDLREVSGPQAPKGRLRGCLVAILVIVLIWIAASNGLMERGFWNGVADNFNALRQRFSGRNSWFFIGIIVGVAMLAWHYVRFFVADPARSCRILWIPVIGLFGASFLRNETELCR